MTQNYKKVQREIFSADFEKYCRKNIVKDLMSLEKKRTNYIIGIVLAWIIAITLLAGIIYYSYVTESSVAQEVYGLIIGAASAFHFFIVKMYKNKAKKIVLPRLISYIGNFKIIEDRDKKNEFRSYLDSLNLMPNFDLFSYDDCLKGTYKDVHLDIIEVNLKKEYQTKRGRRYSTVFQGLFIKFKSFKTFEGCTVIKRESLKIGKSKEQVVLEDPVFEKHFDVKSTDQIEARYLITPAFMNRLLELNKRSIGQNLTMSFEHGFVNIAVSSSKDWFEVPILKPVTEISNYRSIVIELLSILSIVDVLKMDQNIGM